ncbi:MAG: hypothetical protein A3J48_03240 [Candidatus Doudnabacteria bacterium RIFCSPHIGHO2_02_FULL_46_11]|uniref:Serine hydrolase family protein n=1 Tax=Candidatus Doudnabacteria bacterium RIFCSPHIGHO2_02_FULL_46_11 TaxID=1817832 RepID=A0A1F5P7W9_9BACT|nr:MAG: hypothetical protein A3J48_03240 [Candidatus Doudnabacteria bacterium RIFCSPHIGHO2_02_FULL_46_11]
MKNRVFIIHGYGGHPSDNWFPWLKTELEKLGYEVYVPAMPNTDTPQLAEWLSSLKALISTPDGNTYFVGHSLGCITILRYLESLGENQKVGGAVLAAAFIDPIILKEVNHFVSEPLNAEKIKQSVVKGLVVVNSDNDPYMPFEQAEKLKLLLNSRLIKVHNGAHLSAEAGYTQLPVVLEELDKLINK